MADLRDQIAEALRTAFNAHGTADRLPQMVSFGTLADAVLPVVAEAEQWHDTYQQHANDVDEFLGVVLDLLPGARNTGSDAYDQIPRGIERLADERDRARRLADEVIEANEGLGDLVSEITRRAEQAVAERDEVLREFAEERKTTDRVRAVADEWGEPHHCSWLSASALVRQLRAALDTPTETPATT